jgi:hypothetical protein
MSQKTTPALYVCYHQGEVVLDSGVFKPLYVGKNHAVAGENIHDKNAQYGELTALYWIWKNDVDHAVLGLCHYRRFFQKSPGWRCFARRWLDGALKSHQHKLATDFPALLNGVDWILPKPVKLINSVREEYNKYHPKEDLGLMRWLLVEQQPAYVATYDAFLEGNTQHLFNMFVTTRVQLQAYCAWLFPLLFSFEQQDTVNREGTYQQRVLGFMAERLLNVYVLHNRCNIGTLPVVQLGENALYTHPIWVKLKDQVKDLIFSVSQYRKRK